MSQHKSLQGSNGLVVKRNVLKRFERVDLLKETWSVESGRPRRRPPQDQARSLIDSVFH